MKRNWVFPKQPKASGPDRDGRLGPGERRLQDCYEELVSRDWERFQGYALHLCNGNPHDAEDLLSETMIDAYRAFASYRGTGFDRWFFRMLQTNRIDMARRSRVRRALSLDTGNVDFAELGSVDIPDPAPGPEDSVENLLSQSMEDALASLPDKQRIPLLMSDVDEEEYEDIARILDLPLGTVKSRIHRARARLKAFLTDRGWQGI